MPRSVSKPVVTKVRGDQARSGKAPAYTFSTQIPTEYNGNYVGAIPRDPEWLFVYWEFTPEVFENLKVKLGPERCQDGLVMKIRDLQDVLGDDIETPDLDIELPLCSGERYVKVPQPGHTYSVQAGFVDDNGDFVQSPQVEEQCVTMPSLAGSEPSPGATEILSGPTERHDSIVSRPATTRSALSAGSSGFRPAGSSPAEQDGGR